jgi:hypothetical protein
MACIWGRTNGRASGLLVCSVVFVVDVLGLHVDVVCGGAALSTAGGVDRAGASH